MLALNMIVGGWLALNAVVFAALILRRDQPAVRNQLFLWVVDGRREAEEGLAADSAHKPCLDVGQPKVIRPVVAADRDRVGQQR
jgi:hypothetical protein